MPLVKYKLRRQQYVVACRHIDLRTFFYFSNDMFARELMKYTVKR